MGTRRDKHRGGRDPRRSTALTTAEIPAGPGWPGGPGGPYREMKSVGWKEAPVTRPWEAAGDQPQEQALNLVTAAPPSSPSLPSICSCI